MIATKLATEDLWAAYEYSNKALGLYENVKKLVSEAEEHLKSIGKKKIIIHLGDKEHFFESWNFYPEHGYEEFKPSYMMKHI